MNLTQLAGSLPRDPQFREWVAQYTVPPSNVTSDEAAEFIRVACGIDSRRQLAENAGAAEAFHQFIRRPFVAWREQQQDHRRAA